MVSFARHISSSGLLARVAGGALLIVGVALQPPTSHAAAGVVVSKSFTVVSVNSAATPPVIMVQKSPESAEVSVTVLPGATIVRRFEGRSDLTEISAGDHIQAAGTETGAQSFSAVSIKDTSIQVGFTQVNATVSYVSRDFSQMAVHITANESTNSAFGLHSTVMVNITPGTPVTLLHGQSGTVQQLRPGMVITFYGFSDSSGQLIANPHAITELLDSQATALTRAAPNDSSAR